MSRSYMFHVYHRKAQETWCQHDQWSHFEIAISTSVRHARDTTKHANYHENNSRHWIDNRNDQESTIWDNIKHQIHLIFADATIGSTRSRNTEPIDEIGERKAWTVDCTARNIVEHCTWDNSSSRSSFKVHIHHPLIRRLMESSNEKEIMTSIGPLAKCVSQQRVACSSADTSIKVSPIILCNLDSVGLQGTINDGIVKKKMCDLVKKKKNEPVPLQCQNGHSDIAVVLAHSFSSSQDHTIHLFLLEHISTLGSFPSVLLSPRPPQATKITDSSIELQWNAVDSATLYTVELKGVSSGDFKNIYQGNQLQCSAIHLSADTEYSVQLKAFNSFSTSTSEVVVFRTQKSAAKKFEFQSTFDTNGVLYWLGTNGGVTSYSNPATIGKLRVVRSSDDEGDVKLAAGIHRQLLTFHVGRDCKDCSTKNFPKSSFMFNFGSRSIQPTYYSIRHGWWSSSNALRSWELQGSNDATNWDVLREHTNDNTGRKVCCCFMVHS